MNESKKSEKNRVAADPTLPVPEVLNATENDNYTLDQYEVNFGVTALIPFYKNNESTDTITFNWDTVAALSFPLGDKELPYSIDVSNDMNPDCLAAGTYSVSYSVKDQGGNISDSVVVDITVTDNSATTPTLPKPQVPAADVDGWINHDDAIPDGLPVIVSCDGLDAGNVITLFWLGYDDQGRSLDAASTTASYIVVEGDTTCTFTLDQAVFQPNGDGYEGTAECYYTVTSTSPAVLLSYTSDYNVDTKPAGAL